MKRTKIIKYVKPVFLLFTVSLLLWNCEKEHLNEEYQPKGLIEKIQHQFNKEAFKEVIPYEFEVVW